MQSQLLFLALQSGGVDFNEYPGAFILVLVSAFVGAAAVAMQRRLPVTRPEFTLIQPLGRVGKRAFEGACLGLMAFALLAHLVLAGTPPEIHDSALHWGAAATVSFFIVLGLWREEVSEIYSTVFGALLVVVAAGGLHHRNILPPNQNHAWAICDASGGSECWTLLALWPLLTIAGLAFNRLAGRQWLEEYLIPHLLDWQGGSAAGGYEAIPSKGDVEAARGKNKVGRKEKKVPHYFKRAPLAVDHAWG